MRGSTIRGVLLTVQFNLDSRTLRASRERAGLSRESLAYLAGVSTSTIYRVEGERVEPRRSTARALVAVLNDYRNDETPAALGGLRQRTVDPTDRQWDRVTQASDSIRRASRRSPAALPSSSPGPTASHSSAMSTLRRSPGASVSRARGCMTTRKL